MLSISFHRKCNQTLNMCGKLAQRFPQEHCFLFLPKKPRLNFIYTIPTTPKTRFANDLWAIHVLCNFASYNICNFSHSTVKLQSYVTSDEKGTNSWNKITLTFFADGKRLPLWLDIISANVAIFGRAVFVFGFDANHLNAQKKPRNYYATPVYILDGLNFSLAWKSLLCL